MIKKLTILTLVFSPLSFSAPLNTAALEACSLVDNDFKRLLCYDRVIAGKPIKSSLNSDNTLNKKQAEVIASTKSNADSTFGHEDKIKAQEKSEVEQITSDIVSVKESAVGIITFTLNNKQKWKQASSEYFSAKKGDTVIIKRASFGSFLMKKQGSNRTTRVKRVD